MDILNYLINKQSNESNIDKKYIDVTAFNKIVR